MLYSELTGLPEHCFQPPYETRDFSRNEESEFTSLEIVDEFDCETCRESIEMMSFEDFEILPSGEDACCEFGDFPEDWDEIEVEQLLEEDGDDILEYEMEALVRCDDSIVDSTIDIDEATPDSALNRLIDDIIVIGIK